MRLVTRLQATNGAGWLSAAIGSTLQIVVRDAFFWLFWILIAANIADWVAGRFRARNARPCAFSRKRSRQGLYEKAIALVVILLIRSLEAVTFFTLGVNTFGIGAAAITAALIYEDIESLDRHRMALGKKPIPLLSTTLSKMRELTGGDRRKTPREDGGETP